MKSQILRFSETCFVDFFSLFLFSILEGSLCLVSSPYPSERVCRDQNGGGRSPSSSSERNTNQHFCAVFGLQTQTNSFKDFEAVLPERAASWPQLMLGHSWLSFLQGLCHTVRLLQWCASQMSLR